MALSFDKLKGDYQVMLPDGRSFSCTPVSDERITIPRPDPTPLGWEGTIHLEASKTPGLWEAIAKTDVPCPPFTIEHGERTWSGIVIYPGHPQYPATPPADFLAVFTPNEGEGAELFRRLLFTELANGYESQEDHENARACTSG